MLRSLNLLGEREAALALFDVLSEIYNEERRAGRNGISETSDSFRGRLRSDRSTAGSTF